MQPAKVDIVEANKAFANPSHFGHRGKLGLLPTKKLALVTCMDCRLNPAEFLGLKDGEAHVIRNAGGLVKDPETIRSLVISQRLAGTEDILVVHHTTCGMLILTNDILRDQLTKAHPGDTSIANAAKRIDFGFFSDLDESVKSDVEYLKTHPLIEKKGSITGWVYEVENGKIRQVV